MIRTQIQTPLTPRRISPENVSDTYDWTGDPEVKKEMAREAMLAPQPDPEIMAAMKRAAERLMNAPVVEPAPRRDRSDRIPYSLPAEVKQVLKKK